ncbi:MAG: helix-turn-helix transcriptional regulator [Clostridiales bacterium]|nr:helix-turn-helix transcriptional regulator [Clostridiales bacterium]
MYHYDKLWNLLSDYGITKTEFMKQLGVSSATFAKLSSNQPVTLDVLERICHALGCSLDNIVTFDSDPALASRWIGIDRPATYLINLYFIYNTDASPEVQYLYGYACPFNMTPEGMDNWQLSPLANFSGILEIRGYCTGDNLFALLGQIEDRLPLGKILDEHSISLRISNCPESLRDILRAVPLCNGTPHYRPAYLLEPSHTTDPLREAFQPQAALDDCTMRCESLVTANTRTLYCTGSTPDTHRIKLFSRFLKSIYRNASANDMARLGNFEVLSYLNQPADNRRGIHWKVLDHENKENGQMIADALEITIDHHIFSGQYVLLVRTCNTNNLFLEHMKLFYCTEQDYTYTIPLQESVSSVDIRLYQPSGHSTGTNLVADSAATLIRSFHFTMHIVEQRFQLDDEWIRLMQDKKEETNTVGEHTSREDFSFGNEDNELWLQEEKSVSGECRQILNFSSIAGSGLFLSDGDKEHAQFLKWLHKKLKSTRCSHVILIDPYVDSSALSKLIWCIDDANITYDIFTCTDSSSKDSRITDIKKMTLPLQLIAPANMHVYALPKGKLHDRLLILHNNNRILPEIYSLSNSLDNLAEKHASIIIPLDTQLTEEVNHYYLELIRQLRSEGQVEEIFSVTQSKDAKESQDPKQSQDAKEAHSAKQDASQTASVTPVDTFEAYQALCSDHFADALTQLAYMEPGELKKQCIKYVTTAANADEKFIQLLDGYLKASVPADYNPEFSGQQTYETRQMVGLAQHLVKPMDQHLNLISYAESTLTYYMEYGFYRTDWSVYYGIRFLCRYFTKEAVAYLADLREQIKKENGLPLRHYLLAAQLLVQITSFLSESGDNTDMIDTLLNSDIPFLHALVIAYRCQLGPKPDIPDITDRLSSLCQKLPPQEQVLAHIYQIMQLQIRYYRKKTLYADIQAVIDQLIDSLTDILVGIAPQASDNQLFSSDDLYNNLFTLYSRNSEDICKIYLSLFQKKYLSGKNASDFLLRMLLYPYEKGFKDNSCYYRADNLSESRMIIQYMNQIHPASLKSILASFKKMNYQLSDRLYSVTLKAQNYSLWKCYIDLFCCLVYLELWMEQEYHTKLSKAVTEFCQISSNYTELLQEYSEVYQTLTKHFDIEKR